MSVYLADKAEVSSIDSNWRVAVSRTDTNLVRNLTLAGLRTAVRTWEGATAGDVFVDGSGAEDIRKTNLTATSDPTSSDDSNSGYRVGSRWINTITGKVWEAVSVATLAAVWKDLTATSPPGGSSGQFQINDGAGGFSGAGSYSSGVATLPALAVSDLTATRMPYATTSGRLADTLLAYSVDGNGVLLSSVAPNRLTLRGGNSYVFIGGPSATPCVTISTSPVNGLGMLTVNSSAADRAVVDLNAYNGQTANLIQATSYNGTAGDLFKVGASGKVSIGYSGSISDHCIALPSMGLYEPTTTDIGISRSNLLRATLGQNGVKTGSLGLFGWSAVINDATTLDTAIARNAAGVGEANNGTAGQYRDWIFRSIGLGVAPLGVAGCISGVTSIAATGSASFFTTGGAINFGVNGGPTSWSINNGHWIPNTFDATFDIGNNSLRPRHLYLAGDCVFGTTTGTKFGTSVSQKMGWWNATPIVQPSAADQVALINNTAGTYDGTLEALPDPTDSPANADALRDDLVSVLLPALRNNFTDLYTQVAAVRTALVNAGLMKGAA